MKRHIISAVLVLGIVLVCISMLGSLDEFRFPGDHQGYRPEQPIAFSHRVHAGDLTIDCLYCHPGAERSRTAGVPSANMCMNCHKFVTASLGAVREEERLAEEQGRKPETVISAELQKLYDALGLDASLNPDPSLNPQPVVWNRVHKLPDFVAFDHRPHVAKNIACQNCHGPIERMDRVRQFSSLGMGWCVDCHRKSGTQTVAGESVARPLDCTTCHY
jgi:hypothetical protein